MSRPFSRGARLIGLGLAAVSFACGSNVAEPSLHAVALHIRPVGADGPFALNVGTSLALEALPFASDSTLVGDAFSASWRSSDTTVVSVSNQGVVQSHCAGYATVEATTTIAGHPLSGALLIVVAATGPRCAQ